LSSEDPRPPVIAGARFDDSITAKLVASTLYVNVSLDFVVSEPIPLRLDLSRVIRRLDNR